VAVKAKYEFKHEQILRDARPWSVRMADNARDPFNAVMVYGMGCVAIIVDVSVAYFADLILFMGLMYFWWLMSRPVVLPFKLPKSSQRKDPNNVRPDGSKGMADGILYLGNDKETGEEIWFTNSDARTHCLYLGTTGSGKTFGLKSYACNALCWSSGFIYIDGKADTDLWSTLSAMARRFGRDDDLLIMNYMTGNSASGAMVASNTLNPFSSGSASYLTNMLVSLMPDSEGDNAMWKERAVALVSALMPCLVYKREVQNIPLSIGVIRQFLTFKAVIKLSRDTTVPEHIRAAVKGYLNEVPGYNDSHFDDSGNEKQGPDGSMPDTSTANQQHGYLAMQFTRSMQSLGDDYGFIFDTQAADVDMMDVVLQRRILVVLIPALEKSSDETANLGKIIASTLKGMMGATLGSSVEGTTETAIENKPTNSSTPFIAIFDEVGYYTSQGMAVMAAQARSLGFSLVFAGQDLPALEKRVKEEARSITANCNIKLFGKLEDPTQTKDFFEKTVGTTLVTEVSGFQRGGPQGGGGNSYMDSSNASIQQRARASYDGLRGFTEGRAVCAFGKNVNEIQVYNSDIGHAKAMRVQRFLPIPPPAEEALDNLRLVDGILRRLRNPKWDAAAEATRPNRDIDAMAAGFAEAKQANATLIECGVNAVAAVAEAHETIKPDDAIPEGEMIPPMPEPDPEGERVAAQQVAAKTATGPLNWMQVIGASEDDVPGMPMRRDPPVTEQKKPVSWADVLGPEAGEAATAAAAPPPEATKAAAAAKLGAPLSWAEVIGAVPIENTAPVAPLQTAPPPPPVQPPPVQTEARPLPQTEAAPSSPLQPAAPPPPREEPASAAPPPAPPPAPPAPPVESAEDRAAKAAKAVAEKTNGRAPMSWADVIGAAEDVINDKTDGK
jgi:intracellular multiplication protein IcmO